MVINESLLMVLVEMVEGLLLTVECQGLTVLERKKILKNNKFCNHYSEGCIKQVSSINAKSRGKFCLGARFLYGHLVSSHKLLISSKEE